MPSPDCSGNPFAFSLKSKRLKRKAGNSSKIKTAIHFSEQLHYFLIFKLLYSFAIARVSIFN
jgi:hypothetical protein